MADMDELFTDVPNDPREGGMQYPNFHIIQTPTGHNITLDDTKGHESVTIQHASGSTVQFLPDGSTIIKSEKDGFEIIFGNKTLVVSGGLNIVVNGQADMRVMKNYNLVVHGDMNVSVAGKLQTIVGGDVVTSIAGKRTEDIGNTDTTFVTGKVEKTSTDTSYYAAYSNFKTQSIKQDVIMQSGTDIRMFAGCEGGEAPPPTPAKGDIYINSAKDTYIKAGKYLLMQSEQKATLKSSNYIALDGEQLFFNSEMSETNVPEA